MRKKDEMYGFQKFKTMQSFGKNISNRVLTPDNTIDDSIILKKNRLIILKMHSPGIRRVPQGKTKVY